MLRSEFDNLIETKGPTDEQYEIIETVYTYHPAIDNVHGKHQVAALWDLLGMLPFEDMLPRAEMCREIEQRIREHRTAIRDLEHMREYDGFYQEVTWISKDKGQKILYNKYE